MNGLKFWKMNAQKYPILAQMASEELLSVASLAPSERVFSEAKNIEIRKKITW